MNRLKIALIKLLILLAKNATTTITCAHKIIITIFIVYHAFTEEQIFLINWIPELAS